MELQSVWVSLAAPVPGDFESEWSRAENYYPVYQAVARTLAPGSIFEIGTRVGHSLIAMASDNPRLRRIEWVDDETYVANSNMMARANLSGFYRNHRPGWREPAIAYGRTYPEPGTLKGRFDLCHVDGDHSYEGKLRDLEYCLKLRPLWIIADDFEHHPQVGRALVDWTRCSDLPLYVLPTLRGMAVIPAERQIESWTLEKLLKEGHTVQQIVQG